MTERGQALQSPRSRRQPRQTSLSLLPTPASSSQIRPRWPSAPEPPEPRGPACRGYIPSIRSVSGIASHAYIDSRTVSLSAVVWIERLLVPGGTDLSSQPGMSVGSDVAFLPYQSSASAGSEVQLSSTGTDLPSLAAAAYSRYDPPAPPGPWLSDRSGPSEAGRPRSPAEVARSPGDRARRPDAETSVTNTRTTADIW